MNFGAIEREQTEKDVLLGSFTPTTTSTRPDVYLPEFKGEIESQHQTPSCGAHAGQSLKQILNGFVGSPEYLWKKMRLIDKLPANSGSWGDTIFTALKNSGICSIKTMPNNSNTTIEDYASPNGLTTDMDIEAANHKTGVYAFLYNPSLEQIKQSIYDHKGVIALLRVGAEFWTDAQGNGSWSEKDILPLRSNVPITSAHWVTLYGYLNITPTEMYGLKNGIINLSDLQQKYGNKV